MKKIKLLFVILFIIGIFPNLFAQVSNPYTGDVLFVKRGNYVSDSLIVHQLSYMGFNVIVKNDVEVTTADADGKRFVYVSSSTNSGDIKDKFKNVPIPVLMIEGKATDEMGMTLLGAETQSTADVPIRDIEILVEDHYLAAGLKGIIKWSADSTLYSQECRPGGDGILIGEYVRKEGDAGRIYGAIYAYEKGDVLADGSVAAGRRYFAVWYDNGFKNFTADGFKLWLASINWASGFDVPTGVNENSYIIPTKYALYQNYPNPFNPSTKISFSLPTRSNVTLTIYNLMGQKVATLVNETMNAGNYTVQFNASNLASGVYFYQLTTDNFTSVKEMIYLK